MSLDAPQLRDYLAAELCLPDARLEGLEQLAGGASRQTYRIDVASGAPGHETRLPLIRQFDTAGGLLDPATAREYALLVALQGSGIPLPRPLWRERDPAPLGQPFSVTERLPGVTSRKLLPTPEYAPFRRPLAVRHARILAQIHRQDWRALNCAELLPEPDGDPAAFALAGAAADLPPPAAEARPGFELARQWLQRNRPAAGALVLVHGDFRSGNIVYERDRVHAVLDWEIAHLGDPLEDIAWYGHSIWDSSRGGLLGGLITADEFYAEYEAAGGAPIDRAALRWWELFVLFRMGALLMRGGAQFAARRSADLHLAYLAWRSTGLEAQMPQRLAG